MMGILAWRGFTAEQLGVRLNAVFWTGLLLLSAIYGLLLMRVLRRSRVHPLPVIASFYSLVSLHYQLPVYLFFAVGLTLVALLWIVAGFSRWSRGLALGTSVYFAAIALYYHAAMPQSRHLQGDVAGERRFPRARLASPLAGIYVDSAEASLYNELLSLTWKESRPGDSIFVLPTDAELYFLARRTNPFRFYNTALGVRSPVALDSVLHVLTCHAPKLVFYKPDDKYNTPASARIAAMVQESYQPLITIPPFQVFRRPSDRSSLASGSRCDSLPVAHD
jgi:hypothetical protein